MIGILAVQGGVAEHERTLAKLGRQVRLVRRVEHLEGLEGIIFPGGESTTMSKLLTLGGLYEPLKEKLQQGLPAFGTCAGMILLANEVHDTRPDAVSFGALDISVRRNAFGRQIDSFEADLDFSGVDQPVHAVFIRAPWVERVGPNVEVLARAHTTDGEGNPSEAIVGVRQDNVIAISFHPEVTEDTAIHELFLNIVDHKAQR
ncbi:pyridoxal 5'-phosphate synthase glutaminase subunit PdxT [Corynebacterium felinum]|uniref:Pyridoxal 5'-phosphate synthase subunit PdxT n=1 Tax=Corynebacterium felinum TaxID=131318 RepID=A0ABU2B4C4_9CORY|nr:pyridoxal 5'-phosphate synthase glutaminase subunit PdxT [Corynebacterium felinum]MDF5821434.1 pyridoxal 5'-phosphate synthase glutaminase subunit PdxT [Corynebacterium felinum]MDR7353476.1 5'-phosphate synthase pdxT subunit [Corynebacterium felinum]WJY95655.1 Glutamine amidotransferase subunit PdxT [Corynebacterium felinum]